MHTANIIIGRGDTGIRKKGNLVKWVARILTAALGAMGGMTFFSLRDLGFIPKGNPVMSCKPGSCWEHLKIGCPPRNPLTTWPGVYAIVENGAHIVTSLVQRTRRTPFSMYLCLVPIAAHTMVAKGLQNQARKWLLVIITSMFALMTVIWILSVTFTVQFIDSLNKSVALCHGSNSDSFCIHSEVAAIQVRTSLSADAWLVVLFDIPLVNFIITDGVIVWRAWVLCSDQSRVVLVIPVIMLAINTVIYLITVTARVIEFISYEQTGSSPRVLYFLDIIRGVHVTLSLLINVFTTSIIALKAWKYRKLLVESGLGVRTPSQAIRILAYLVESGVIYILIGVTTLAFIVIPWLFGLRAIPSVSITVTMRLVGIYPIAVLLLVEKNCSLNSTYCSLGTIVDARGDRPSQAEPINSTPGPVLTSGGQIDLAMKPSKTSIHVTIEYMLEPGDAGTSTGGSRSHEVSREEHAVS